MIETANEALEDLEWISEYVGSSRLNGNARNKFKRLHWYLLGLQSNNHPQQVRNELDGFIRTMDKHQQAIVQLQEVVDVDAKQLGKFTHWGEPTRNWITFDD